MYLKNVFSHKLFMLLMSFLLSNALGLIFLYSGYAKLYPIEPFELTFIDLGIGNWSLAPFIARFMIGLEFFIGFTLIFGLYLKHFTLKFTAFILVFFSIYLVATMFKNGNTENCGCFGTALVMTPLQALIKNAVMLIACLVVYKFYDGFSYGRIGKWLIGLILLTSLLLPHVLNYVDLDYSQAYLNKPEDQFKLELDSLYKDAKLHTPPQALKTGKHIIAFMSLTCPHCRIAAKKFRLLKEKNSAIPIYFVLNGEKENFTPFFKETKTQQIPYCQLNGKNFIYLAGLNMPVIYLVNNSIVEHVINYQEIDQTQIEQWLAKP